MPCRTPPPNLFVAAYGQISAERFSPRPTRLQARGLAPPASFQALLCVRYSTDSHCPPNGSRPSPANCDPWSTATIPFDDFRRKRRTGSDRRSSRHPTRAAACRGHALCNTGAKTFSYMTPRCILFVGYSHYTHYVGNIQAPTGQI